MGKRGPKPAGLVELTTTITPELDRALNRIVAVSGLSRSTVVRVARRGIVYSHLYLGDYSAEIAQFEAFASRDLDVV